MGRGNGPTMGLPGTSASAMVTIPLHRTASISTISTNATADNLPGPGRNVGLLFGWIGGHLEVRLGRVMSHRGYGPDAVANTLARVRRHHVGLLADFYSSAAEPSKGFEPRSKAERRKVQRLCKTLLKYTTSHVESTQIAACNRITDLAIYDPYIRLLLCNFLSSNKADLAGLSLDLMSNRSPEGYLQDDYDPLLSSSRTALISVTETRVHELWAERSAEWLYSVTSFHALKSSQEEYERAFKSFEHFLDHGMVSLLQSRCVVHLYATVVTRTEEDNAS
ncbi:hypothetical protein SCHPADRAFT_682872 [Schizopora paradoxa]|uniref:Uncharacterized protein n=1 Tax=Schizopora paradoxa TaxID=27342 RepID=A0A0H2RPA9_9AGAM|nr:hypothetical protein SCHPADRAFT_682872 [Schizopora paradoxa]